LGTRGHQSALTRLSNDQSPSLSQSRTSILLAVSLIRPKAIYIVAAAPTSLPSSPSQTTRLRTRALPIPRFRRSNETLPAFLAATSSHHCASVDPTSPNGRILDPMTHIATQSCPNLRSHPQLHPRSHGSRIDPRVDHDLVTAEDSVTTRLARDCNRRGQTSFQLRPSGAYCPSCLRLLVSPCF